MFELLSGYLDVTATPEQKATCLQACKVLSDAGLSDHEFLINQELEIADQSSGDFLINLVESILKPTCRNQLKEFGVTVNIEATLAHCADVLNGICVLDNYDDLATVYAYCETVEGPVAALADILPLVGGFKSDDYLTFIDDVTPELIDRIASMYENVPAVDEIPVDLTVDRARQRINRFMQSPELSSDQIPIAIQEAMDGGRIGLPLSLLIERHLGTLSTIAPPRLAIELVAFIAVSDVYETAIESELAKVLDMLGLELSVVTITSVQLKRLLKQVC